MLAHARKNLLTVMALQSPQHLTSPDLADVLLLPEGALLSRCSCPVTVGVQRLAYIDVQSPVPYRLAPVRLARNPQNMDATKYWQPPIFHCFSPNFGSI